MASRVRELGVRLVFVAMPTLRSYELDPAIRDVATRHGATLLDLRAPAELAPDAFRDALHLNAQGAELYTRALVGALAPVLREDRAAVRLRYPRGAMEQSKLRAAVVGAGRMGGMHARSLASHPRAQLVAVVDTEPETAERVARSCQTKIATLEQVLSDDDLRAVAIAAPTAVHAGLIERCADAGKAIFCEKPIDLDVERARGCVERVTRVGLPFAVGFNRRSDPNFAALRSRLQAGEIGAAEIVRITSRDPGVPPPGYVETSGGFIRDMMIHDFDMARWLLDEEPVEVYAMTSCLVDPAIAGAGDVDTAVASLRTARGVLCQIDNTRRATYGYDQRIEVHGARGMLRAGNARASTVEHADAAGYRIDPALPDFLTRYPDAYRAEIDAFVAAVLDGSPPSPTGEDGLRALVIADAAARSAELGRPVAI